MNTSLAEYYSFRNVENGSWFIQSLCDVFIEAAKKPEAYNEGSDLLRLLTAVNRKVAYEYQSLAKVEVLNQMKEMPNFLSTLTKIFYLKVKSRPGKWVIEMIILYHSKYFLKHILVKFTYLCACDKKFLFNAKNKSLYFYIFHMHTNIYIT